MYRYAADSEIYWLRDKCRIIAVIRSPDILSAHPQEIIPFPQLPDDLLWRIRLTAHLPVSLRDTTLT